MLVVEESDKVIATEVTDKILGAGGDFELMQVVRRKFGRVHSFQSDF